MFMERKTLASFIKRHQIILTSLVLALLSLHLALTGAQEIERGAITKEIISVTVTPLQRLILGVKGAVSGVWSGYINLAGTEEENTELKAALISLQEENSRLKEEINLNSRLKTVLEYRESAPFKTTAASVVGFNFDRWSRTVTINKGREDGIEKDMAVVSPLGVVGRIIETNRFTSKVLLNTDLRYNIDVLVHRSRIKGVIEGNGADRLILKYVRQIDDVRLGDQVLTSGLSGVFPKGIPVGEVVKIEKGRDNFFKFIEVRPAVEIQRLEEVLVVTDAGFLPEE